MTTFLERAVRIATALNQSGLWDEADGFFYDLLRMPDGSVGAAADPLDGGAAADPPGGRRCRAWRPSSGAALGKHFARVPRGPGRDR